MEIRGKTISYSSYKKKENETLEKQLIQDIDKLEQNITEQNSQQLDELKSSLEKLRKIKMQGVLIRSRAQIIVDDEKPTKYFCNLENHNFSRKIIPKLEKENGLFIKDQDMILEEAKLFYQNLYSNKDYHLTDIDLEKEMLNFSTIPKLDINESQALEGLLTYEQASLSLKNMANNKSPGTDGFGAEFFKMFWKQLGHFVVRSINFGFLMGELSVTQKQGIITCLPKENKSRYQMKNYRPISLLNCVIK